jgi:hypothetical protein
MPQQNLTQNFLLTKPKWGLSIANQNKKSCVLYKDQEQQNVIAYVTRKLYLNI